jgi:hypothetical protein
MTPTPTPIAAAALAVALADSPRCAEETGASTTDVVQGRCMAQQRADGASAERVTPAPEAETDPVESRVPHAEVEAQVGAQSAQAGEEAPTGAQAPPVERADAELPKPTGGAEPTGDAEATKPTGADAACTAQGDRGEAVVSADTAAEAADQIVSPVGCAEEPPVVGGVATERGSQEPSAPDGCEAKERAAVGSEAAGVEAAAVGVCGEARAAAGAPADGAEGRPRSPVAGEKRAREEEEEAPLSPRRENAECGTATA